MAEQEPFLVVVAQQRSGTTVFTKTLGGGARVHNYGEVFHSDHGAERYNFFSYRLERFRAAPELSVPTDENVSALWDGYREHLRAGSDRQHLLIDVKYNSWHHLNPVWHMTGERPHLLELMRRRGDRLIHLVRRDVFSQACSALIARARGIFQVASDAGVEPAGQHVLDASQLRALMEESLTQAEHFHRFLSGYPHVVDVAYEDLFAGDRLAGKVYERLHSAIGTDVDEGTVVPLRKVLPPLSEVVENVAALRSTFADTPWARMVDVALSASAPPAPGA